MHIGIRETLLLLLVLSAALGVAGSIRKRDKVAYALCAAIALCAILGLWRDWAQRMLIARNTVAQQESLDAFLAVRHVPSTATLAMTLTLEIPCAAAGAALRQAVCDEHRTVAGRAAYDDLASRMTGDATVDVRRQNAA